MIRFNNVSFSYGEKQIFKDLNLEIKKGDRICLFAPSGYGKTTLLRLIMGLEKPDSGSREGIDGKKISVVFQEDRLIPQKNVYENIELFGGNERISEILNNIQNLYKVANKREVVKIQDEFFSIYQKNDLEQLKSFARQLDIIAEGYNAQTKG